MSLSTKEQQKIEAAKHLTQAQLVAAIQIARTPAVENLGNANYPLMVAALLQAMASNYESVTRQMPD
jgi:hypothetical protein